MKKAMYVVMVLIIVLLPGMGRAQEPSDNGTVPPYTLWLPMVGDISLSCPYQATGPGYIYGPVYWSEYPQGYLAVSLVNQIEVEEERDLYTLGIDIVIATDSEMKDVVAFTTASYRIKYGIFEATPYNLEAGKVHYAKARVACFEYPDGKYTRVYGPWTEIVSFVKP